MGVWCNGSTIDCRSFSAGSTPAMPAMKRNQLDECECGCHHNDNIMHIVACCSQCSVCEKRIKYNFDKHHTECKNDLLEKMEKVLARKLTIEEQKNLGVYNGHESNS